MIENNETEMLREAREAKERRERCEAIEKAEADAQKVRVDAATKIAQETNERWRLKQEAEAKQIAEQNAKNTAAQAERDKNAAARRLEENKAAIEAYRYRPYDPTERDHLVEQQSEAYKKSVGYNPKPEPKPVAPPKKEPVGVEIRYTRDGVPIIRPIER
jgi:hypothetical protein